MSITGEEMLASFQAKIQDINDAMGKLETTLKIRVIERDQLIAERDRYKAALEEIVIQFVWEPGKVGSFNYGAFSERALRKTKETH